MHHRLKKDVPENKLQSVSHCEDKAPERQNLDKANARRQVKKRPKLVLQHLVAALRHCHLFTLVPVLPTTTPTYPFSPSEASHRIVFSTKLPLVCNMQEISSRT
jgi:hypothetical protein